MILPPVCYLFSYFVDNGEDGLHLAWSADGYRFAALQEGKSFLPPQVGESRLMRDPCLLAGPDGLFRLVWTTSWRGHTIGYAYSRDLLHWSEQRALPVMAHEPGVRNCWAPELAYDAAAGEYVIFWASTVQGQFPETAGTGDEAYNHRIYCTTTREFVNFSPTRLFYDGGFNVIDASLLPLEGQYALIVKDETLKPVRKDLRVAYGPSPQGPFGAASAPFTPSWVEGPSALRVGDEYRVYFDCYREGRYGAMVTRDFRSFTEASERLVMPRQARHGTVLAVSREVVERLLDP